MSSTQRTGGGGGGGMRSRPQLKRCYLCGQEFGSASIGIHIPQCYQKKFSQWEHGDPSSRGPRPKHPDSVNWKGTGLNSTQQSEMAAQEYEQGLSPCPHCGRTFLPDRLQVHLRSCRGSNSQQGRATAPPSSSGGSKQQTPPRRPAGPPVLPRCYLCGQQFGTTSIGIHVPQCYAKKQAQWEAADATTRGQAPKHPDTVNWKGEGLSKEQQNDEQFKEFVNNLEPCPHCGRKFLADRLVVHLRSCKPGSTSKPLANTSNSGASSAAASVTSAPAAQPPPKSAAPAARPPRKSVPESKKEDALQHLDPKNNRIPKGTDVETSKTTCRQCGAVEYDASAKFCRDCGHNLRSKLLPDPCTRCGESVPEGSRFCATCGQPVNNAVADERIPDAENVNAPTVRMTHCPACRALCDADGNFCDNCGAALGDAEPVQSSLDKWAEEAKQLPKAPATKKHMYCSMCKEGCEDLTAKFCEECGGELEEREIAQPSKAKAVTKPLTESPPVAKRTTPAARTVPATQPPSSATPPSSTPPSREETTSKTPKPKAAPPPPPTASSPMVEDESVDIVLVPCSNCGRNFSESALDRHMRLCLKTKKRPVFDGAKQRQEGNDVLPAKKTSRQSASAPPASAPKRDWKSESESLRKALQDARKVDQILKSGGNVRDLPPPTYSENPDYVSCPHCQRRFAPDVAARHIPKCATTTNRPKAPPKRR